MKTKTSELTGCVLDWAVAKIEYGDDWSDEMAVINVTEFDDDGYIYRPSIDWEIGGPIIEYERLQVSPSRVALAHKEQQWGCVKITFDGDANHFMQGPTPLVAAMRCYVASQLGDEVEIPDELGA